MALKTSTFRLMGSTITVTEKYTGEFEEVRRFMEELRRSMEEKAAFFMIDPTGAFPPEVVRAIHSARGTDLLFLMEKELYESDISKSQNRIYIPRSNELLRYLTLDEIRRIESSKGLDVIAIDRRAKTYSLTIKMWANSRIKDKYVLIKEWGKLVLDNELRKDATVQIWCYRVNSELHLAVITGMVNMGPDEGLNQLQGVKDERRADSTQAVGAERKPKSSRAVNPDQRYKSSRAINVERGPTQDVVHVEHRPELSEDKRRKVESTLVVNAETKPEHILSSVESLLTANNRSSI